MKQQLIDIINSLEGNETVRLIVTSEPMTGFHKNFQYVFEPSISKKSEDKTQPDITEPSKEKSVKTVKPNRVASEAAKIAEEQKQPVAGDDKPKVDYATFQIERAADLIKGGDFDKAISILQQAVEADRKNKVLAEALYNAKLAKAKAENDMEDEPVTKAEKPLAEIPLPGKKKTIPPNPAVTATPPVQTPHYEEENLDTDADEVENF